MESCVYTDHPFEMGIHCRDFEPGERYHLQQEGNAGKAIYATDADRADAILKLEECAARYDVTVVFFHLADNHGHWVVIPKTADGISCMMRDMQGGYSKDYNTRHGVRAGHSPTSITKFSNFGQRFHASKVEAKDLETLRKYIAIDPAPYGTDLGEPEPEVVAAPEIAPDAERPPVGMQEDWGTGSTAVVLEIFGPRRQVDEAGAPDELTLQPHEYRIVKAIRLATKWNRPVEYAKKRLAEWEERVRRGWRIRWLIAGFRFETG